jgi:hypothetical protein
MYQVGTRASENTFISNNTLKIIFLLQFRPDPSQHPSTLKKFSKIYQSSNHNPEYLV